jgi:acyl dehydratase
LQDTNIDLGSWDVTAGAVQEYLAAVGDGTPVYLETQTAPPLMLAARVVGRLLERLSLPDGAIHSLQDVATVNPTRIGARVSAVARVEPARERGGMRFLTVNYTVAEDAAALDLMRGRTTVLLPVDNDSSDQ